MRDATAGRSAARPPAPAGASGVRGRSENRVLDWRFLLIFPGDFTAHLRAWSTWRFPSEKRAQPFGRARFHRPRGGADDAEDRQGRHPTRHADGRRRLPRHPVGCRRPATGRALPSPMGAPARSKCRAWPRSAARIDALRQKIEQVAADAAPRQRAMTVHGRGLELRLALHRLARRHGIQPPVPVTLPLAAPCPHPMVVEGFATTADIDLGRMKFRPTAFGWPLLFRHGFPPLLYRHDETQPAGQIDAPGVRRHGPAQGPRHRAPTSWRAAPPRSRSARRWSPTSCATSIHARFSCADHAGAKSRRFR